MLHKIKWIHEEYSKEIFHMKQAYFIQKIILYIFFNFKFARVLHYFTYIYYIGRVTYNRVFKLKGIGKIQK